MDVCTRCSRNIACPHLQTYRCIRCCSPSQPSHYARCSARSRSRRQREAQWNGRVYPKSGSRCHLDRPPRGEVPTDLPLLSHCKRFCRCKRSRLRGGYDYLLAQNYFGWSGHLATVSAAVCPKRESHCFVQWLIDLFITMHDVFPARLGSATVQLGYWSAYQPGLHRLCSLHNSAPSVVRPTRPKALSIGLSLDSRV
jgi:hypothetical protein